MPKLVCSQLVYRKTVYRKNRYIGKQPVSTPEPKENKTYTVGIKRERYGKNPLPIPKKNYCKF